MVIRSCCQYFSNIFFQEMDYLHFVIQYIFSMSVGVVIGYSLRWFFEQSRECQQTSYPLLGGCCRGNGCSKCDRRRYIPDPLDEDARRYDPDLTSPETADQAALFHRLAINKKLVSQLVFNTPYYQYAIDRPRSEKSYVTDHFIDRRVLWWWQ